MLTFILLGILHLQKQGGSVLIFIPGLLSINLAHSVWWSLWSGTHVGAGYCTSFYFSPVGKWRAGVFFLAEMWLKWELSLIVHLQPHCLLDHTGRFLHGWLFDLIDSLVLITDVRHWGQCTIITFASVFNRFYLKLGDGNNEKYSNFESFINVNRQSKVHIRKPLVGHAHSTTGASGQWHIVYF